MPRAPCPGASPSGQLSPLALGLDALSRLARLPIRAAVQVQIPAAFVVGESAGDALVRERYEVADWHQIEADGPVLGEAGQQPSVGAERDAADGGAELGHGDKLRAAAAVPQPHGAVRAGAGQARPVGAEGGVVDDASVTP